MHALLPLLLLPSLAAAGPAVGRSGTSIPITRRGRAGQDHTKFLRAQADALIAKYGAASARDTKRANTGTEPLTNQNGDVTYYGTVAVGTPCMFSIPYLVEVPSIAHLTTSDSPKL